MAWKPYMLTFSPVGHWRAEPGERPRRGHEEDTRRTRGGGWRGKGYETSNLEILKWGATRTSKTEKHPRWWYAITISPSLDLDLTLLWEKLEVLLATKVRFVWWEKAHAVAITNRFVSRVPESKHFAHSAVWKWNTTTILCISGVPCIGELWQSLQNCAKNNLQKTCFAIQDQTNRKQHWLQRNKNGTAEVSAIFFLHLVTVKGLKEWQWSSFAARLFRVGQMSDVMETNLNLLHFLNSGIDSSPKCGSHMNPNKKRVWCMGKGSKKLTLPNPECYRSQSRSRSHLQPPKLGAEDGLAPACKYQNPFEQAIDHPVLTNCCFRSYIVSSRPL